MRLSLVGFKRITTTSRKRQPVSKRRQRLFLSNVLLISVQLTGQGLLYSNHSSGYTPRKRWTSPEATGTPFISPTPSLISEYLILFSTKLFPPFTLLQGLDEACWSTGKGWRRGMGALQPSSFPCSQPQHKSFGSILRFGPVQMGSEN